MKGTELTSAQLGAATEFLHGAIAKSLAERGLIFQDLMGRSFRIELDDMIRLLAWYGAIRFRSAKTGNGSLETPGQLVRTS